MDKVIENWLEEELRCDGYEELCGWKIPAEDQEALMVATDVTIWLQQHGEKKTIVRDPIYHEQYVKIWTVK